MIETYYDIGDEVYYFDGENICFNEIIDFELVETENDLIVNYLMYNIYGIKKWYNEEFLYETEEELLALLN